MASQNPFNLGTVTPYLVVDGVEDLISYLQIVLDAVLRGPAHLREDGSVKHAEVSIGDSVIMMGEPLDDLAAMPTSLYVYVNDCDETYRKAISAGGVSVQEVTFFPHGDRYGGVRDRSGNIWWIVTHVGTTSD